MHLGVADGAMSIIQQESDLARLQIKRTQPTRRIVVSVSGFRTADATAKTDVVVVVVSRLARCEDDFVYRVK
jgi:hypothetical protein